MWRKFFLVVTFSGALSSLAIAETSPNKKIATCTNPPPSYAISAEDLSKWRQSEQLRIIDVRPKNDYDAIHIPNSLSAPIFSIKTKRYLSTKSLLLVGKDYEVAPLEKACADLIQAGFQNVRYLRGGLPKWHSIDGELTGNMNFVTALPTIPPFALAEEMANASWKILAVSCGPQDFKADSWPEIKILNSNKENSHQVNEALRQIPEKTSIAILSCADDEVRSYEALLKAIKAAPSHLVFFVEGGKRAMDRFQTQYQAILSHGKQQGTVTDQCQ